MDELTDADRTAYAAVDDALRTYPLQAAPPGLFLSVLRRLPRRQPAPRFRPAWLDYAISLFAASMASLAGLIWLTTPLPLDWPVRLQFQFLVFWQHLRFILLY